LLLPDKEIFMNEEAKDSQQEPQHDSGLQTPQPDQPLPTEQERADQQETTKVTETTETTEVTKEPVDK
jgi:hypothetical protein